MNSVLEWDRLVPWPRWLPLVWMCLRRNEMGSLIWFTRLLFECKYLGQSQGHKVPPNVPLATTPIGTPHHISPIWQQGASRTVSAEEPAVFMAHVLPSTHAASPPPCWNHFCWSKTLLDVQFIVANVGCPCSHSGRIIKVPLFHCPFTIDDCFW